MWTRKVFPQAGCACCVALGGGGGGERGRMGMGGLGKSWVQRAVLMWDFGSGGKVGFPPV